MVCLPRIVCIPMLCTLCLRAMAALIDAGMEHSGDVQHMRGAGGRGGGGGGRDVRIMPTVPRSMVARCAGMVAGVMSQEPPLKKHAFRASSVQQLPRQDLRRMCVLMLRVCA